MTAGTVVAAVIPSSSAAGARGGSLRVGSRPRRPLPMPAQMLLRTRSTVYGFAAVDDRGRVADRGVLRVLGWVAGTRLAMRERGGLVRIAADGAGVFRLTGQGHLRLPAVVRQWCRLVPGDRVLLAADPQDGLLTVYPPAVLDVMTSQFAAAVSGGDGT